MTAKGKLVPLRFKSNIPLNEQDIYGYNFNIQVCKDKTMKKFLGDRQKGYCLGCEKPLYDDRIIHHINYNHKCKKKNLNCKRCPYKKECAKNLTLIHSKCNKEINDIQLSLFNNNGVDVLNNQTSATAAYNYLKYLIPISDRDINLGQLYGHVIIVKKNNSQIFKVISLLQLQTYNSKEGKLFYRFSAAKYIKTISQPGIKSWLEKTQESAW